MSVTWYWYCWDSCFFNCSLWCGCCWVSDSIFFKLGRHASTHKIKGVSLGFSHSCVHVHKKNKPKINPRIFCWVWVWVFSRLDQPKIDDFKKSMFSSLYIFSVILLEITCFFIDNRITLMCFLSWYFYCHKSINMESWEIDSPKIYQKS